MKKCVMCGKEYGWQEWGKHIYKNSNICYSCHSSLSITREKVCACGQISPEQTEQWRLKARDCLSLPGML